MTRRSRAAVNQAEGTGILPVAPFGDVRAGLQRELQDGAASEVLEDPTLAWVDPWFARATPATVRARGHAQVGRQVTQ